MCCENVELDHNTKSLIESLNVISRQHSLFSTLHNLLLDDVRC